MQMATDVANEEEKGLLQRMNGRWRPEEFVKMCERAVGSKDEVVIEWCERVQQQEVRLMCEYVLKKINHDHNR